MSGVAKWGSGQERASRAEAERLAVMESAGPGSMDKVWGHGEPLGFKGRGVSGLSDFSVDCPENCPHSCSIGDWESLVGGVRLSQV